MPGLRLAVQARKHNVGVKTKIPDYSTVNPLARIDSAFVQNPRQYMPAFANWGAAIVVHLVQNTQYNLRSL